MRADFLKRFKKKKAPFALACVCAIVLSCFALSTAGCAAASSGGSGASADGTGEESMTQSEGADTDFQGNAADSDGDGATDLQNTQPVMNENTAQAESDVEALVESYGDAVAVAVVPLDGSAGFSINGDEQFVSASMIKLLILAKFMDAVDAGTISMMDTYTRDPDDVVGGTGVIQSESPGTKYTYADLMQYMIMFSDNTAANVFIDLFGMNATNAEAQSLGLADTSLGRKLMDLTSDAENYMSANDAAAILEGIADHTIASDDICEMVEQALLSQTDTDGLAQGLPQGVKFGHKTGSLDSLRHDGGIVYADNPYVIVVFTDIGSTAGNELMSEISARVYQDLE